MYKSFLHYFTIGILFFVVVLYPVLFMLNIGVVTEKERYLDEWWQVKENYSNLIGNKRKILIVSGSNTLFGVNTELMEKELNVPAVNFGLHGALRDYTLDRVINSINDGDMVVLPLEYAFYDSEDYAGEYNSYIMAYDADYFYNQSLYYKLKFMYSSDFVDMIKGIKYKIKQPEKKDSEYSSKYLNLNGDMTNNLYSKAKTEAFLKSKINNVVFNNEHINEHNMKKLSDFIEFCHNHNVDVYAAWPCYLYSKEKFSESDELHILKIEEFYKNNNVEIIGKYYDTLYPVGDFYDTNYHLNDIGMKKHTKYLIEYLRDKL